MMIDAAARSVAPMRRSTAESSPFQQIFRIEIRFEPEYHRF